MDCKFENTLQEFTAMRTPTLFFLILLVVLSACSPAQTSISQQNQNPLTASRYGDELADTMANLIIQNDPIIKDAALRKIIESEIARGKNIAEQAREVQTEGLMGSVIALKTDVTGLVLYLTDTLYLSSDFQTSPGPSLRIFLTTIVDPRDVSFPDNTAIDLGPLQAAYGPQQYRVPEQADPGKLRTFVLYDTSLKLIYAFAQISKSS